MTYFQTYHNFLALYRHVENQVFHVKLKDLEALDRAKLELERAECARRGLEHD